VGDLDQLRGQDPEAGLVEAGDDLAGHTLGDRIGLHDGQRALNHAVPSVSATCLPMSAGLGTRRAPAASSARIFSAAVPRPPAMIAPAWPMRRPGGAVWPQMKATTGFRTFALMKAAASSSAEPPISPISMIACVSGSSLMRTTSGTPAAAASMIASAAAAGGTKISAQVAPSFATASATVFQTGKPSWVVPPLPGVTPPTTVVP